jgi:hypothetical protein
MKSSGVTVGGEDGRRGSDVLFFLFRYESLLTLHHLAGNAFENGRDLGEVCDPVDASCEFTVLSHRGCKE